MAIFIGSADFGNLKNDEGKTAVGGWEEAEFMDNAWAPVGVAIIIAAAIVAFATVAGRSRTRAASAADKALTENWPDPARKQPASQAT